MRSISVVSVSRADYGIYHPLLTRLSQEPGLELSILVTGMHLSPEFGSTFRVIEQDGFQIADKIETLLSSDTPQGIAKSIGMGILGFAQSFSGKKPDMLVLLGDRFEMYAAAVAALPFTIPVAHIHGGEVTQGAFDDGLRHSLTKLSHLHFVSTQEYGQRVIQLGEEPWRIKVCGAPSLENLKNFQLLSRAELEFRLDRKLPDTFLVVTFHPVTLEYEKSEDYINELLCALHEVNLPVIFSLPNADTNSRVIIQRTKEFISMHLDSSIFDNLGQRVYFSLMTAASAMVGNSSSGIIEAATFKLPVVNIGTRQKGRIHGKNVIDVGYHHTEIRAGISRAISPSFRESLRDLVNPYGQGSSSEIITEVLKSIPLDGKLVVKQFYDLDCARQIELK
jgi:UDP-hydrolysing UDP-N-acetyl-D-glucosamine 2-epimerase